ncbi:MAG TPA: S41 family peptidase [Bryobacteraceae bacterium]|jgi:carboxyl-terminal processing protease
MSRGAGLSILLVICAGLAGGQQTSERQANIDSFERVWKAVLDKHWDPKLGGLDWQAVHDELRPKIEAATTKDQAREVMSSMLARLHQTHFGIFPGDVYQDLDSTDGKSGGPRNGNPGLDLRILEGRAVVTSVEPGSPAAARGVKPGWEIVRVNDKEMAPVLQNIRDQFGSSTLIDLRLTRSVLSRLQGKAGSTVRLEFLDAGDHAVPLELERVQPRGRIAGMGNFPGDYFWAEWRKARPDVGYIRFNMFMDPETLTKTVEDAVKGCPDCSGFVIDVRGNPGGIGGLAMGVAGWFIDQQGLQLGTMYLREATFKFVVFPRPQSFRGPLAVLVDGCSASTSEIFAGGLKDVKRARIFGTRTAGAALPSIIEKLPNGDGFQYAIANYISQGGKPLEGIGVIPDEEVRLTRHQLLEGQDPVLDAAIGWIQKQKK